MDPSAVRFPRAPRGRRDGRGDRARADRRDRGLRFGKGPWDTEVEHGEEAPDESGAGGAVTASGTRGEARSRHAQARAAERRAPPGRGPARATAMCKELVVDRAAR